LTLIIGHYREKRTIFLKLLEPLRFALLVVLQKC